MKWNSNRDYIAYHKKAEYFLLPEFVNWIWRGAFFSPSTRVLRT